MMDGKKKKPPERKKLDILDQLAFEFNFLVFAGKDVEARFVHIKLKHAIKRRQ